MLVNAYSKKVFNLAYQFSGSRQEAEDMTQEIFLKLYGSLGKYDFSQEFHRLAPDAGQEPPHRRVPANPLGTDAAGRPRRADA